MSVKKNPRIGFSFEIKRKDGYGEEKPIQVKVDDETVPPEVDPVKYLRSRLVEELDRQTVVGQKMRGFEPETLTVFEAEPEE